MHIMAALLFIGMGAVAFIAPYFLGLAQVSKDYHPVVIYNWVNWTGIFYIVLGIFILFAIIFTNKKRIASKTSLALRWVEIIGFLLVIIYAANMRWTLPVVYASVGLMGIILAYYFEKRAIKQHYIIIDDNGISIQDYAIGRQIKWQNIKNVILKNNVLSIDNKDNSFYQIEIVHNQAIVPSEFMAYCNEKIESHQHLYQPDWS